MSQYVHIVYILYQGTIFPIHHLYTKRIVFVDNMHGKYVFITCNEIAVVTESIP